MIILPKLLIQIALIIILARCAYVGFKLASATRKNWLDIAFYFSVAIVAFNFL